jgi:hypothetical protein
MPTEEQIKFLIESRKKKRSPGHAFVALKPEEAREIFCSKCYATLEELFGGTFFYVYSNRSNNVDQTCEKIKRMIKDGFTRKEVQIKLGLTSRKMVYCLNRILRKKNDTTKED